MIHPRVLNRMAKVYISWCAKYGSKVAKERLGLYCSTQSLIELKPEVEKLLGVKK